MSTARARVEAPPALEELPASVPGIFLATARRLPDEVAARFKEGGVWRTLTWREMAERAEALAFGLAALGLEPGDRVSLLGDTTVDWVLCELAVHLNGAISVPIYPTHPAHEVRYVLEDSGARLLFVDRPEQLEKAQAVREEVALEKVLRMQGAGDGGGVLDLAALEAAGRPLRESDPGLLERRVGEIGRDDAACFIYTSGTTGPPKGVILTHGNWVFEAACAAAVDMVSPKDDEFFFLPLAHSFGQVLKTAWFQLGHRMSFAESLDAIVDNLKEARPTMMASVPRIFEKVYTKVVGQGSTAPGLKGLLFRWAMGHFDRYVDARRRGVPYENLGFELAKRLVFSKVAERLRDAFGGRIRFFVSGGAPLAPKIAYFFELAGLEILEGYGLTETAAGSTINRPGEVKIGTVGVPLPGVEVKIADDGEILIRGPNVMKGYHGRPEETARAIDREGWFHTGDIGELDEDGYLKITDRKKDIIVTAGGKNVAPQNIENQLKMHPLISQVVVIGDKRKFLSALITLDEEAARGLSEEERRRQVDEAVAELNGRLARYETIKKYAILDHDFTQESGELTPSLKVKRRVVEKNYAHIVDAFYEEKFE